MDKQNREEFCRENKGIELVYQEFLREFQSFCIEARQHNGAMFQQFLINSSSDAMSIFYAPIGQIGGYIFFRDNQTGINFGINTIDNANYVYIHVFDADHNELLFFSISDSDVPDKIMRSLIRVNDMYVDTISEDGIQVSNVSESDAKEIQTIIKRRETTQAEIDLLLREQDKILAWIRSGYKQRAAAIDRLRVDLEVLKTHRFPKTYTSYTKAQALEILTSFEKLLKNAVLVLHNRKNP